MIPFFWQPDQPTVEEEDDDDDDEDDDDDKDDDEVEGKFIDKIVLSVFLSICFYQGSVFLV